MKPSDSNLPPTDDETLFDLLADGQLDEPRRRSLLAGLDDRPGGWRRCALAFLEAQSWREALDAFAHPKSTREPSAAAPVTVPSRRKSRRSNAVTTLLGMAASFLLAIGITSWMRQMQQAGVPLGPVPGSNWAAMTGPELAPVGTAPALSGPTQGIQPVYLTDRGLDGRLHTVGLPAVARDRLDEDWLRNLPSAIPEGVARSFQQAGHEVRPSRQLLPFQLPDGRRLLVPVDQLDIHYVNNPSYQ